MARIFHEPGHVVVTKPATKVQTNDLIVYEDSDEYARVLEVDPDYDDDGVRLVIKHSYSRRDLVLARSETVKVKAHG